MCNLRYRNNDSEEYKRIEGNLDLFTAVNVNYIAGDCQIAPEAKIDDGKLHICVAQGTSRLAMISMLACEVEHGRHVTRPGVSIIPCTELIVEPVSKNALLDIDGERSYFEGARCVIQPASASIIA